MRRCWGLGAPAVLLGVVALGLLPCTEAMAQLDSPWVWGPRLGAFAERFVVVSWSVKRPVELEVHYGRADLHEADGVWEETLLFPRHQGNAQIALDDLEPETRYAYQVIVYEGDATHPSPVGEFTTPALGAYPFRFLCYGNTGAFPERHRAVMDVLRANETDALFLINLGPLLGPDPERPYADLLEVTDAYALSHPYLTVVDDAPNMDGLYYDLFALPIGGGTADEQWWSVDVGEVHIATIDVSVPEGPDAAAVIAEQVGWLAADLARSTARFTIVCMRDPVYSGALPNGVDTELRMRWEEIFLEGGVDLVIASGAGRYEHLYVDGIHHVVSSGGGGPMAPRPAEPAPGTLAARYDTLHYLWLSVSEDGLLVEAVPVVVVEERVPAEGGEPIVELIKLPIISPMDVFTIRD
jgi:hypothetical protein